MHRGGKSKLGAAALAILLMGGCASATLIQTNPEGAKVRIDGAVMGETPFTYEDDSPFGASHVISLEKPGYSRATLVVRRDQANPARVIVFGLGGFICFPMWLGLIWAADYMPLYDVELMPQGVSPPPPPMQAPPQYQGLPPAPTLPVPPLPPANVPPPPPTS